MTESNSIYNNKQRGAAMITVVIFFVAISLSIILGIISPTIREVRIVRGAIASRQSYFLSESGVEDAIYRIKTGRNISASETITLGGASATTTITDVSGTEKQIDATGNASLSQRKTRTTIKRGAGIAFNYGLQSGNGGVVLGPTAGIVGNLYSNGNVIGGNNSYITGSAVAANSSSLIADQVNGTPIPPSTSITFGRLGTQDVAQSFQVNTSAPLNKVQLYLRKTGTPSNMTVRIVNNLAGAPGVTALATGTLSASSVSTSYGWVDVVFDSNPVLSTGTIYWVVLSPSSTSALNNYTIGTNTSYTNGYADTGQYLGIWTSTTSDIYFQIYTGGITSLIHNVRIGTLLVGDAYAHSVTDSTVAGNLYCQTGSGNNKACDTSRADPTPSTLPISDSNIAGWKSEALAGGTITGNYTASGISSLGPTKITGNLVVSGTLTITGTLWVEGSITLNNGSIVGLASGYGAGSGVIVADGIIDLSNNAAFLGSGNPASYIMVLTTSDCSAGTTCTQNAMEVSNNVGTVILIAQNGTIHLNNNSGAKEVVANKILVDNGSIITYDLGLADVNFTSGPSGGWNVDSWQEIP